MVEPFYSLLTNLSNSASPKGLNLACTVAVHRKLYTVFKKKHHHSFNGALMLHYKV